MAVIEVTNGPLTPKHVGEKILLAVRRAHMTQQDLAFKVGVEPSTVSRWVKGRVSPSFDTLVEIARVTRCRELLNNGDLYDLGGTSDQDESSSGWMWETAGQAA